MSETSAFENPGQDPSYLAGDAARDAELREQVEADLGSAIDETFTKNAPFVERDPGTGAEKLVLYVPFREEFATVEVSKTDDAEGERTVDMTFSSRGAWNSSWRFVDSPTLGKRLMPCDRDSETGALTPKTAPTPTSERPGTYDATSDKEVAYWGKLWPNNLRVGTPEKPKPISRLKNFGRSALRRARGN